MVARILPTLLMMMVLLGAFYPAVDLTAGEKERGTLQTLITSPARPVEIIAGKFLTVFCISMVAAMANLVSMAAAFTWLLSDLAPDQAAFQVDFTTIALLMAQLIPVGCLVSAGMLAVCVFARSYKEAQHYLTPIYIFLLVPIILSALPGVTLTKTTAWMPALNVMLLIRTALVDPLGAEVAVMVFVANCVWAILVLAIAVRAFESEEVLLGGDGAAADAFRIKPADMGVAKPSLTLAIVSFCLGMVLLVYAGGGLQKMHLIGGMLATQWGLIAATSLLVARGFRLGLVETFSWRRPSALAVVGAILLGAGAWAGIGGVVAQMQEFVLPVPESFAKQMSELLGITDDRYPIWIMLATFALTPAICEEVFFRGLFMSGLRSKLNKWPAIIVCGLGFGMFHLSIYRILPTAILGMVIAWVLWETRSIIPCIILHAFNNGTALCVSKGLLPSAVPNPVADGTFNLTKAIPWALLCLVGFVLIYLGRAKGEAETFPQ
jgi:sodium transport system permease protein